MPDSDYICCVNLDEDWWIKIVNNYGINDFINIKNNLRDIDEISTVEDLFTHLILPLDKQDQYGNIIHWEIADNKNLYTLNELPPEYYNKDYNPKCCFDPESAEVVELAFDSTKSYFDNTIIDF